MLLLFGDCVRDTVTVERDSTRVKAGSKRLLHDLYAAPFCALTGVVRPGASILPASTFCYDLHTEVIKKVLNPHCSACDWNGQSQRSTYPGSKSQKCVQPWA